MFEGNLFFLREKIVNLKEKIRQMNIEGGALAIRKVNYPLNLSRESNNSLF
jgi:hypothetical protein